MMISRSDTLRAAGSLPLLLAAGAAGAAAGTDESPALAFATAQAERLSAPLQTVRGTAPRRTRRHPLAQWPGRA